MIRTILISTFLLISISFTYSQDEWNVPVEEKENLSIYTYDEDFALEGNSIYENSCTSCHGTPGQADFSVMVPSPGDVATKDFQNQKDGELFYKIKIGRGAMPGFENTYSSEEMWSLIAFIRSFNLEYKQQLPNLEGIEIPKFTMTFKYDDNVDKLVVKVLSEDGIAVEEVSVTAFIKSMFGKFLIGKSKTNKIGIAYFDIDSKIPSDSAGYLNIIAKASKGYGSAKKTEKMQIANPIKTRSAIAGRHLWSARNATPIWLLITFFAAIIGIWGTIFYIIFSLKKIKNS